jgi:dTDP-4-dehydrorhamnose reductase
VRTLLVTGAAGQLGHRVLALAAQRPGLAAVGLGRSDLDICDPDAVERAFDRYRPDVVLHAAAFTAVDAAESHADEAFRANRDGTAHVARAAAARGIALLHISTDYVFDGTAARGYLPGDPTRPLGVYGASKLAGEEAALAAAPALARIFRVAWLYDREGRNFLNTMLRAADAGTSLRVVDDQTGTPTHAGHFAELLLDIAGDAREHHLQYRRDQFGLRSQQHAQRDRQRQHPLPNRHVGDDVIHQVRRGLRHPARTA